MICETIVGLDPSLVQNQPLKWHVFRTKIATLPYTLIRREEDICTTP